MVDALNAGLSLLELGKRMGEGERLPMPAVWAVGKAVAHALSARHAHLDEEGNPAPLLHLHLCPALVWIAPDGRAALLEAKPGDEATEDERRFEAPEQARGERVTPRTDVYRLGRFLCVLLGGELGGADPEMVRALETSLLADAGRRRMTCEELEQWCSHFDPMDEGRRVLLRLLEAHRFPREPEAMPLPEPPRPPPIASNITPIQRPKRISRAASLAIACVTAALVYGLGLWLAARFHWGQFNQLDGQLDENKR